VAVRFTPDFREAQVDEKAEGESYSQWMERIIKQELAKSSLLLFFLVFLAGFLTSLTPCVYPVIPIVMGFVGSRSAGKRLRGFMLSVFFVLGLALVYSMLGVIAAKTGSLIGISLQSPVVVIIISAIFIIMGLSLAGLFTIPVPASLTTKVGQGTKRQFGGAFILGGLSGIIAAPCVGPVLIALLSWISQTGDLFLGFLLTFTFSLGLGVIFLLVGTFSGLVSALPKGGKWMESVKTLFALLLIGGGFYILKSILPEWLSFTLWGFFLIATSVFIGLFDRLDPGHIKEKVFKLVKVMIFLVGAFLFYKGIEIKFFPPPDASIVKSQQLNWMARLDVAKKAAREEKKLIMIDTYADWCFACKELERKTFSKPMVFQRLKDFVLVKLDFTKNTEENKRLRKAYRVIGMPTVIFLNDKAKEIKRFSGFMNEKQFLKFLDSLNP
jgi:thiol:disulfide interchange protein DsbD